jgi:DNA-directed RNA polymerase specialized sigma24 family protein
MSSHDFDRFVATSTDGLLRTAYLIVRDLQEAEDLVQETLFKVARRWPKAANLEARTPAARA